jgi:hypothetical protein
MVFRSSLTRPKRRMTRAARISRTCQQAASTEYFSAQLRRLLHRASSLLSISCLPVTLRRSANLLCSPPFRFNSDTQETFSKDRRRQADRRGQRQARTWVRRLGRVPFMSSSGGQEKWGGQQTRQPAFMAFRLLLWRAEGLQARPREISGLERPADPPACCLASGMLAGRPGSKEEGRLENKQPGGSCCFLPVVAS